MVTTAETLEGTLVVPTKKRRSW